MRRQSVFESGSPETGSVESDVCLRALNSHPFEPHPAIRGGHAQTILGNLRPRRFDNRLEKALRREFKTAPTENRVIQFSRLLSRV